MNWKILVLLLLLLTSCGAPMPLPEPLNPPPAPIPQPAGMACIQDPKNSGARICCKQGHAVQLKQGGWTCLKDPPKTLHVDGVK
jgi:hypothetical protein